MINIFFSALIFILLTIITQIGGIVYIISILLISNNKIHYRLKRFALFVILYMGSTFLLIPNLSSLSGRVKIKDTHRLSSHSFFTKLLNRNYVTMGMHEVLTDISIKLEKKYPGIAVKYLDANFPFFDRFPLLPHLSHSDGKKIDITFIYEETDGMLTNSKKSRSGYGIFVHPNTNEVDRNTLCKGRGYWQYDFPKYLTFGSINPHLKFSGSANKTLLNLIVNTPQVEKIFIEPHLKNRLQLKSSKIRFQGCKSVRHDDHIHIQIR